MRKSDLPTLDGYSAECRCLSQRDWGEVLAGFADANFYQTWEYGAVRWGARNLSHLLLKREGRIVAAAQVRILRFPPLPAGMAYVLYGPLWQGRDGRRQESDLKAMLRALVGEYALARGLFLRLRPQAYEELDGYYRPALEQAGLQATRGPRQPRRTILLDLSPSEEVLRRGLKKNWRYNLRQSEGSGLEIEEGFDDRLFEPLEPVYRAMVAAKQFKPGSSIDEFRRMQGLLESSRRLRITVCRAQGTALSGSVCSATGDTAIGLLSASAEAGRKARAYYLLQWDEICWAKQAGKRFYDLGGINPVTNPGVYSFKAGLGGREVSFLGVFDYCRSRVLSRLILGLERLRGRH